MVQREGEAPPEQVREMVRREGEAPPEPDLQMVRREPLPPGFLRQLNQQSQCRHGRCVIRFFGNFGDDFLVRDFAVSIQYDHRAG